MNNGKHKEKQILSKIEKMKKGKLLKCIQI